MKCENLDMRKRACRVNVGMYKAFKNYGFKDQITRSFLSIPSDIAKGVKRYANQKTVRFLDIAKVSCAKFITQIYIATEIGFFLKDLGFKLKNGIEEISQMKH